MLEDGAQFTSHADTPNLRWGADDETWVADRNIKDGEEITFDYRSTSAHFGRAMESDCGQILVELGKFIKRKYEVNVCRKAFIIG